jgi:hypothetical protein
MTNLEIKELCGDAFFVNVFSTLCIQQSNRQIDFYKKVGKFYLLLYNVCVHICFLPICIPSSFVCFQAFFNFGVLVIYFFTSLDHKQ